MHMRRYIVYYRVSTERQGRSGLGLEAQEAAVRAFLDQRGGKVIESFTEIESGRNNRRPELEKAMDMARAYGAVLVIAKLDRLARDAHFLLGLEKAGVDFVAADMPDANRLTVGILALVAEDEAKTVSSRTKAALAARKARGHQLGNVASLKTGDARTAAVASQAAVAKAAQHATRVMPIVARLKGEGLSLQAMARRLNEDGVPSARGGAWTATSVRNLLTRDQDKARL
jgi:DNA invertase Pin-like site-specific DNA recombinase